MKRRDEEQAGIANAIFQETAGWTMRPKVNSWVFRPERQRELAEIVFSRSDISYLAKGSGASFADAALNGENGVLDVLRLNKFLRFDTSGGMITCMSGVTLADILGVSVPAGWFIPVTPGTSHVTVGGCFASDVHGKNHHHQGSFAKNVEEITLLTGSGDTLVCSAKQNADLFWATSGGMGLSGIILTVTVRLIKIETAYMNVFYRKSRNFEETFRYASDSSSSGYSVTWLDPLAHGKSLGRGVTMNSEHTKLDELNLESKSNVLDWKRIQEYRLPWVPSSGLMHYPFVRAFNYLYYHTKPNTERRFIKHAGPSFYPMDRVLNWNLLFGRKHGFLEYQIVVGEEAAYELCHHIIETLGNRHDASIFAVLKKFGPESNGHLSFPKLGYTLSIEFPIKRRDIFDVLRTFDHKVAAAGGRLYFAKDSCMDPELVDVMYPRRREWADIVNGSDPNHIFDSSLNRRLKLRDN